MYFSKYIYLNLIYNNRIKVNKINNKNKKDNKNNNNEKLVDE